MRLYTIDTARPAFWGDLNRTDLCFICDEDENADWQLARNDVVFAHSHENYEEENPDLVLSRLEYNWEIVKRFCLALESASQNGNAPIIVLYGGGDNQANWIEAATAPDGALHGFPAERIRCYPHVIPRRNCANALGQMVGAVLSQLDPAGDETPLNLDTSWLEAVKLAARLLVEAAEAKPEGLSGIRITKPTGPLLSAARQVIETAERQENIIPSANALCEALGCPQPTQP